MDTTDQQRVRRRPSTVRTSRDGYSRLALETVLSANSTVKKKAAAAAGVGKFEVWLNEGLCYRRWMITQAVVG
ncbi:hypothetical protein PM082_001833 [Marasmius tenuissimus]|nr:hypothetical protein PM082_001833 [Marasmius tenuissimus]